MTTPRITNDDRGITINKSLAWSLASAFLLGGLWLGTEVMGTKQMVIDIRAAQIISKSDETEYRRDVDARLRLLEQSRAGDSRDLTNAINLLTRIDARLERIEQVTRPD